jgi:hypothetical protein
MREFVLFKWDLFNFLMALRREFYDIFFGFNGQRRGGYFFIFIMLFEVWVFLFLFY